MSTTFILQIFHVDQLSFSNPSRRPLFFIKSFIFTIFLLKIPHVNHFFYLQLLHVQCLPLSFSKSNMFPLYFFKSFHVEPFSSTNPSSKIFMSAPSPLAISYLLASRNVTSLSSSKSFLFPTRMMTMAGLARVRASVNQFARLLKDSRELTSQTSSAPDAGVGVNNKYYSLNAKQKSFKLCELQRKKRIAYKKNEVFENL